MISLKGPWVHRNLGGGNVGYSVHRYMIKVKTLQLNTTLNEVKVMEVLLGAGMSCPLTSCIHLLVPDRKAALDTRCLAEGFKFPML